MSYRYLPADDPSIESFHGAFFKIRRALGTNAFGVNEIRMPPGFEGPEHDESDTGHDEVYAILAGSGTITVAGEAISVGPGDYLRVEPGVLRQTVAGPDGLTFLALGAKPKPEYDGRESL